ncbi:hypothetical protein MKX64_01285 [Paenibacillus sp. FSL M8-0334]|uniref:hypothetical protein n=1 Tax=Paenibacillus sp. FSL M8-0334 TaxID=2921623 RepID=UPI0030F665FA
MKSLKKSVVLLLSLSLLLAACGGDKTESDPSSSNQEDVKTEAAAEQEPKKEPKNEPAEEVSTTLFSNEYIQFEYPSTWVDPQVDNALILAAFVDANAAGGFADNVNIVLEDSAMTAQEAANQAVSDLTSSAGGEVIQNYQQISYTDALNGDYDAGILTGSYTQGQSGVEVMLTQYFVATGDQMYTMSLSFAKDTYEDGGEQLKIPVGGGYLCGSLFISTL